MPRFCLFSKNAYAIKSSKVIAVLCTSANICTPAHIALLDEALRQLIQEGYQAEGLILIVHQNALLNKKQKVYKHLKVKLPEYSDEALERICFTEKVRRTLTEIALSSYRQDHPDCAVIHLSNFEMEHIDYARLPATKDEHPCLEHWQSVMRLQELELIAAHKEKRQAALYVSIVGSDTANGYFNWQDTPARGLPCIVGIRGEPLHLSLNQKYRTQYFAAICNEKKLKPVPQFFLNFKSRAYTLNDECLRQLSASKIANCHIPAINTLSLASLIALMHYLHQVQSDLENYSSGERITAIYSYQCLCKYANDPMNLMNDAHKKMIKMFMDNPIVNEKELVLSYDFIDHIIAYIEHRGLNIPQNTGDETQDLLNILSLIDILPLMIHSLINKRFLICCTFQVQCNIMEAIVSGQMIIAAAEQPSAAAAALG